MAEKTWEMPEWMERYRPMLDRMAGGNTIERLMNSTVSVSINAPLALICCNVKGAVNLLEQLHRDNALLADAMPFDA